ncbi:alpha/beta-hydrolase [Punctularia strigosozonata HHB-11173 SS5]|uniref:Carboxylic ester hydrolase n=1 Tax=Punctularia strigosozonata (strain HHB-11173) TaxID=741275 RepID=R7S5X5_PUNST|nr:alpha/beta-hydrolase [Punctularia strigosozonata HHB-11173 SS5]EIN05226.1 alpha/beta-hydrolase [Punctularia strigosozonata HHB-11173 SS5]
MSPSPQTLARKSIVPMYKYHLVALAALTFCYGAIPTEATPRATVRNGTYVGFSLPSFEQELFLGMPYAQQPLPPNLRLRPPVSLNTSWNGTRNAMEYSPICIGYPSGGANDDLGHELSEACLTLNIVRPAGIVQGSNVPVVVWIYGGGFQMGGSADQRYNGSWVVQRSVEMKQPIIFASINYRVTAFGFLWSQEIAAEGAGNFGLLDQHLALRWIHENIDAFGGDPSKVTIMGESAGGQSVAMQLLAFGAKTTDLFRAGIAESGSASGVQYRTAAEYQPQFNSVVNATGCSGAADVVACLRSVPVETFIAATNVSAPISWSPVIDGSFLKSPPTATLRAGKNFIKVPFLTGANLDEGGAFGQRGIDNDTALVDALRSSYPHLTNESITTILQLYPDDPSIGCPYNTSDGILSTGRQDKRSFSIFGDTTMHAGRRLLAQSIATAHDVFTYHFAQPPDNATIEDGVSHFQEVAYVFSNPLPTQNPLSKRAGDAQLANLMTSFWVSFIHNLDPNYSDVPGAPRWPSYREHAQNIVFKRQGSFAQNDDYRAEGIAFLNTLEGEMEH